MPLKSSQTSTSFGRANSLTSDPLHLILTPRPDPRGYRSHHEELSSSFRQEVPKTKEGEAEQLYNGVLGHNNRYFILDAELRKTEWESLQLLRLSDAIKKSIASEEELEENIKTKLQEKQEKLNLKIDETKEKLTELKSQRDVALKEASQLFKPYSPNGQIEASTEKKYEILLWVRGDIPMQYIKKTEDKKGGTWSKFTKSWHEEFSMAFGILLKKFKDKETEKSPACFPFFGIFFSKPFANKKVTKESVEKAIQNANKKEDEFRQDFKTSNIKKHFANEQEYVDFSKCYNVYNTLGGKLSETEYLEKQEMAEFISLCLVEKIQKAKNATRHNPDSPIIICIQEGNNLLWNAIAPKKEVFAFQNPREILIRQISKDGNAVGNDIPLKEYPIFTGNREWYSSRFNIYPLNKELDSDAADYVFGKNNPIIFNERLFENIKNWINRSRASTLLQGASGASLAKKPEILRM